MVPSQSLDPFINDDATPYTMGATKPLASYTFSDSPSSLAFSSKVNLIEKGGGWFLGLSSEISLIFYASHCWRRNVLVQSASNLA